MSQAWDMTGEGGCISGNIVYPRTNFVNFEAKEEFDIF